MFFKKLPNGLDVLVVEDNSVPLVTIQVTFKAGSFNEDASVSGLNGIFQLMRYKGNRDFPTESDFNYFSGALGLKLMNSITSQEYSTSYFTLPKSNFTAGLNFMNTAVRYASYNAKELEKEKIITDDELKQKQSNPLFLLNDEMAHHLWGDQYSRKNPIGDPAVVNAATAAAMLEIRDKYYYPNNALLIIAGDVAHDDAFLQVEKIYSDWVSSGFDMGKKWPVPEFKPLNKSDYFIVQSRLSNIPTIAIYWQGPDTRSDLLSTYSADVFSYVVNQNSSRLSKALVQSGLASTARIGYLTQKYVGPISLIVTPNPDRIKECLEEIKKQIDLMDADDYLSDEQLEDAKRILEIQEIRSEEVTSDYAHTLSFWWSSASLNYYMGYFNNLKKISHADIKAYVQKYIKNKPYCAGLLISPDLEAKTNAKDFFK